MFRKITRLPAVPGEKRLYLTFDDGPDPVSTPAVLDLLHRLNVKATFFCIARRAEAHPELFGRIASEHAVGNHSLDHKFGIFFASRARMRDWVAESDSVFRDRLGVAPVGFRSPAGVVTPPLLWALRSLEIPLVHWSERFYDTRFRWTEKKALRSIMRAWDGDIVLLHDRQSPKALPQFCATLEKYIVAARARGIRFCPVPSDPVRLE